MISVSFSPSDLNNTAEVSLFEKGNFASGWAYKMKLAKSTFSFKVQVGEEHVGMNLARFTLRATTLATDTKYRTYSLKVNGTAHIISFVPGTLGEFTSTFGGAAWAEYEAKFPLVKGLNEIIITTHAEWGGFDKLEIWAEKEPKLYTEEQLKSPEMASFLKSLGIYFKADLDKAVADAKKGLITPEELTAKITEATKGLLSTAEVTKLVAEAKEGLFTQAQVDQKILEVKDALPLLIQQAVESKTPTIQTQAIENYKSKIINIIEQS